MRDLATLTVDDVAPTVGTTYVLDVGAAGPLELELLSAEVVGAATSPSTRAPFSLVFAGPAAPALDQAIYAVRHEGLGELELLLVPIAADPHGRRYEAVFG